MVATATLKAALQSGERSAGLTLEAPASAFAGRRLVVTIDADGSGSLEVELDGMNLSSSSYAVAGRAFILHAKPDDFGQPTGNAGARIGCGSIVITG